MKLVRFLKHGQTQPSFGFLEEDLVYDFLALSCDTYQNYSKLLESSETYLSNLPSSYEAALALRSKINRDAGEKIENVKLLSPIEKPAGLFDFGLTPRHLVNSAKTMLKYEFGSFIGGILFLFVKSKIWKRAKDTNSFAYYKGNHQVISGPYDDIIWPTYTSYLDIEPELAFVIGTKEQPLAGYCIFNDISARDVQFPEMLGTGPAKSKDFSGSNTIGPYLLTPDEVPDPLSLTVKVEIGNRLVWTGSTSEYTCGPMEVIDFISDIFSPSPSTIIGMGTVPGCTGMDNDQWLLPDDTVLISFDKLGRLKQKILPPSGKLLPSRWKLRKELKDRGGNS